MPYILVAFFGDELRTVMYQPPSDQDTPTHQSAGIPTRYSPTEGLPSVCLRFSHNIFWFPFPFLEIVNAVPYQQFVSLGSKGYNKPARQKEGSRPKHTQKKGGKLLLWVMRMQLLPVTAGEGMSLSKSYQHHGQGVALSIAAQFREGQNIKP